MRQAVEYFMQNRQAHKQEVLTFLQRNFSTRDWHFTLPGGSGMETYFVRENGQRYFVKVGAPIERYLQMADAGLTPPILASGELDSGLTVIVQPWIASQRPSRQDFRDRLESVAEIVQKMHNLPQLKETLQSPPSHLHKDVGLRALIHLRHTWRRYEAQVPHLAGFVENSLGVLAQQVNLFSTEGLVASHNDICNANWLFASDGKVYLVDFDLMCLDDPALDLGALLWWYYPPEIRGRFLDIAGYRYEQEFKFRMQVRMAMHCLHITLPRDQSFDQFDPDFYGERLNDFRAILAGHENPQGYSD
jgi:thiamine kinase-like enzyme